MAVWRGSLGLGGCWGSNRRCGCLGGLDGVGVCPRANTLAPQTCPAIEPALRNKPHPPKTRPLPPSKQQPHNPTPPQTKALTWARPRATRTSGPARRGTTAPGTAASSTTAATRQARALRCVAPHLRAHCAALRAALRCIARSLRCIYARIAPHCVLHYASVCFIAQHFALISLHCAALRAHCAALSARCAQFPCNEHALPPTNQTERHAPQPPPPPDQALPSVQPALLDGGVQIRRLPVGGGFQFVWAFCFGKEGTLRVGGWGGGGGQAFWGAGGVAGGAAHLRHLGSAEQTPLALPPPTPRKALTA